MSNRKKNNTDFILGKIGNRFVITIPQEARDVLKWKVGDTIAIWTKDEEVLMIAKLKVQEQLEKLREKHEN